MVLDWTSQFQHIELTDWYRCSTVALSDGERSRSFLFFQAKCIWWIENFCAKSQKYWRNVLFSSPFLNKSAKNTKSWARLARFSTDLRKFGVSSRQSIPGYATGLFGLTGTKLHWGRDWHQSFGGTGRPDRNRKPSHRAHNGLKPWTRTKQHCKLVQKNNNNSDSSGINKSKLTTRKIARALRARIFRYK